MISCYTPLPSSLTRSHIAHQLQLPIKSSLFYPNNFVRFERIVCSCSASSLSSIESIDDDFDVELERLLALLPDEMRSKCSEHSELRDLIEVVMDLGRKPLARFPSGDFVLSNCNITAEDLEQATSQVGDFATDNRAGISRTLHRISAIRNRKGTTIGLTCRVGRAISGSANLLRDLVQDGTSLLLIGPPGVGKTTIIREIARMLANDYKKRVMIVDTSNEIGGDGDIPHAGIGNARRMQVPYSDMQHKVLIEAVENHMPQVIVIDEIGTKLEATAASTIAQRGIQLVATAHGVTIENLIMNPSLEMLVGGIQGFSRLIFESTFHQFAESLSSKSVTLGDEEANRRRVQKTVLERKGPSTFGSAVEIISKTELQVHRNLEATVDAILSGRFPNFEVRKTISPGTEELILQEPLIETLINHKEESTSEDAVEIAEETTGNSDSMYEISSSMLEDKIQLRLYVYGISEASATQVIKKLKLDDTLQITDNISEADVLLALQARLKKNPRIQSAAKSGDIPIYMTKTSSLEHITKAIKAFMTDHADDLLDSGSAADLKMSEKTDAMEETRIAIEHVVIPRGEPVNLLPRSSHVMDLQINLIRTYQLNFQTVRSDTGSYIRILPFQSIRDEKDGTDDGLAEFLEANGETKGSSTSSVSKLPLLPG